MKKILLMSAFGLMLSACTITVFPGGGTGTTTTITGLSFSSNYTDNTGKSLVCDNRTTNLTYSFSYSGSLDSWTSSLIGVQSGQTAGTATFYLTSPEVNAAGNQVAVTYSLSPGTAPLSVPKTGAISPQSIIVSPVIKGYTDLKITFYDLNGGSGTARLGQNIPVVDCP